MKISNQGAVTFENEKEITHLIEIMTAALTWYKDHEYINDHHLNAKPNDPSLDPLGADAKFLALVYYPLFNALNAARSNEKDNKKTDQIMIEYGDRFSPRHGSNTITATI